MKMENRGAWIRRLDRLVPASRGDPPHLENEGKRGVPHQRSVKNLSAISCDSGSRSILSIREDSPGPDRKAIPPGASTGRKRRSRSALANLLVIVHQRELEIGAIQLEAARAASAKPATRKAARPRGEFHGALALFGRARLCLRVSNAFTPTPRGRPVGLEDGRLTGELV
jgi:hypothetical protein